ncbi:MAG: DUF2868 domain-containing protein [Verrucomicrobiae bacterium]|nr:DUF2868 domain-containing protein [Verrucomicrobiae bacterium]
MRRPSSWSIADVIDLEYLLGRESGADEAGVRERVLGRMRGGMPALPRERRRTVLRAWLETRREGEEGRLPGRTVSAAWRLLGVMGWVVGAMVGAAVTGGLLNYRGAYPVNVALFLGVTVGVPLLFLVATMGLGMLRWATGGWDEVRPVRALLTGLAWLGHAGLRRLPGEQREGLRGALATVSRKREIYGSLAMWPVWIVTQGFAVAFSGGVLAVLLAHVAATDLAFGWQSTLSLGPEAVERLVTAMAWPWSAWAPQAKPGLQEIVGSRFTYTAGVGALDPAATASWWPFLAYAVGIYGLAPRVLLLAWAMYRLRAGLRAVSFNHERGNALYRRLTGPVVRTEEPGMTVPEPEPPAPAMAHEESGAPCLALVAAEMGMDRAALEGGVSRALGWRVDETMPVRIDHPSGNPEVMAAAGSRDGERAGIVVVVPGRRSPIRAMAVCLRRIGEASGGQGESVLLVAGRSGEEGWGRATEEELRHWRRFQAANGLRWTVESWPGLVTGGGVTDAGGNGTSGGGAA